MEPQSLEFTVEDILQSHRCWITELYLNDQKTEEEIVAGTSLSWRLVIAYRYERGILAD